MSRAEPVRRAPPDAERGTRLPRAALVFAAWVGASLVAGCGAPVAEMTAEDAAARECLSRLEIRDETVTLRDIGETYTEEEAWPLARKPFEGHYRRITEADAFNWGYIKEIAGLRARLLKKTRQELAEMERKTRAEQKKEAEKTRKAEAKAKKEAKRRATVKAATSREGAGDRRKAKKKAKNE